jgi:Holliday junction resolvase
MLGKAEFPLAQFSLEVILTAKLSHDDVMRLRRRRKLGKHYELELRTMLLNAGYTVRRVPVSGPSFGWVDIVAVNREKNMVVGIQVRKGHFSMPRYSKRKEIAFFPKLQIDSIKNFLDELYGFPGIQLIGVLAARFSRKRWVFHRLTEEDYASPVGLVLSPRMKSTWSP